jgi:hypothetical protein
MFRHFAPTTIRIVPLALALVPCVTSTSIAVSGELSTESEWATQNSPLTFALREGVTLTLAPGTKVVRKPSIPVPVHLKDLAPRAYAVEVMSGRLDVNIDTTHKPIYSVMVRGPRRTAAFSNGGHSTLASTPQGIVIAAVSGTELSATVNDKWRPLHVGTALVVTREMPSGTVHDLLKRPNLQAKHSLKLSVGGTEYTTLNWSAVPDAQSYRVSVRRRTPQGSVPINDYDVPTTAFVLPQIEVGTYSATVSAVDRWNMTSAPSNEIGVRVVGVAIPEGAYLVNGIPQLGQRQQISLSQTEGLEVAYGSGTTFEPAPHTLGVPTGHPVLARFREVGTTEEVALRIEPQTLESSIEFAPKGARWPGQAIKVVVRVSGPKGADLPETVSLSLSTTVNTRPVEAKWAHEGHVWQTRIEQPPIAGPWVLRINVTDKGGQLLAYDFLEVAEAQMAPVREFASRRRYATR